MVYTFRVILDAEEDIFRDIAILSEDTSCPFGVYNTSAEDSIFEAFEVNPIL